MADNRLLAQLQHAIQYPSGHLDQFASFGPAFEMTSDDQPAEQPAEQPAITPITEQSTQSEQSTQFDARRFITGGNAIFTLQGLRDRYTYRVSKSDDGAVSFVALLTGPENTSDYTYVGLLSEQTGTIRLTRKSRYSDQSQPVRAFNWAVGRIWRGVDITPAKIYHVGRCGRCGRALTVPSSIESGFGPECLGKLG